MNRSKKIFRNDIYYYINITILTIISITLYECYGYEHYNRQVFPLRYWLMSPYLDLKNPQIRSLVR